MRLKKKLKIKLFTSVERLIALRNLKPKRKEGFLKVISIFSFIGIMLGVAILIIVMSVMNGFRTELTNKILGFNPHVVIKPYNNKNIDFVEGEFKGDYFYGTMKFKDSDKRIKFVGKVSKNLDRLVEGELYLRDGSKYKGTFKNNRNTNNGKYHYSNGTVKKVKNGKFSKSINIINYLNLYNILGLVIIGSFLLHLNANKQLYSGKKKFNLIEAIKSFMDTPLGGAILLLILAIILFKVFNAAVSTDLGRPRFFGHDGG